MVLNYLKIAFRNLQRNSIYSFINIFGLAIGLCSVLLIMLWVSDEVSYDNFHENSGQLYQVLQNSPGDDGIHTQYVIPLPLAEEFKTNERDIKYVCVTDWGGNHLLTNGDNKFTLEGTYVGEDFLKMFSFPLIKGNQETALKDPSGIVLTQSTAMSLFGDTDPMGKIVRLDNRLDMTVTGVAEDVPANSSLQFQYLLPFATYISSEEWVKRSLTNWGNNAFLMYVQLEPTADVAKLQARVKNVIRDHDEKTKGEPIFHALNQWRLYSRFENGKSAGGTIEFIRSISLVAMFILLIACINFMNMSTARSERRAREVGIRKTIGSKRNQLIFQFLGESLVITALSFLLAIVMTELSLPFFNALVSKQLSIPYHRLDFWLFSATVVLVTGVIAGSYPAFYLSAFKAVTVLKGKISVGRKATPRKVLVTLQFCFTIFHVIGAIIFYRQIEHGKERYLGYNQENLLLVENSGDIGKNYQAIKQDLVASGLAVNVTKSNSPVTQNYAYMDPTWSGKGKEQRTSFATIATEYDYLKTLGIPLKEGRDFSEQFNDSASMILNQAAVEYIGFKKPIGETVTWEGKDYTVVGVSENVVSSPYQKTDPAMIIFDPEWVADITIRMTATNGISESLHQIEKVFNRYNPAYPFQYRFVDDEFNKKFTGINMIGIMAYLFSGLAIVISCLGLFGLAAFTAEQRSKEIGIRKVMGASVSHIVMLLSKDFTKLILIAFAFTAPTAWWLFSMWLQRFPYRIEVQGSIFAIAGGLALTLALATISYQAIKAAVADPVNSLRNE